MNPRLNSDTHRALNETILRMQVEDIQTYERNREMARKSAKLGRDISKANTAYHSARSPAAKRKADRAHEKAIKASRAHGKVQRKESGSKTLYGKGGKVIRKGTAAHKAESEKSERDWGSHMQRQAEYGRKMETHPNPRIRADWNAQMGGYRDADEASGARAARDRAAARRREGFTD